MDAKGLFRQNRWGFGCTTKDESEKNKEWLNPKNSILETKWLKTSVGIKCQCCLQK